MNSGEYRSARIRRNCFFSSLDCFCKNGCFTSKSHFEDLLVYYYCLNNIKNLVDVVVGPVDMWINMLRTDIACVFDLNKMFIK